MGPVVTPIDLNDVANKIILAIHEAKTPQECAAVSEQYSAEFGLIQKYLCVRGQHIINLATLRRNDFKRAGK